MRHNVGLVVPDIELVYSEWRNDAADDFSWNVTAGTQFQKGDIGICIVSADTGDTGHDFTISGWTSLYNSGGDVPYARVFAKTMDGTETAVASTSGTGMANTTGILQYFRNAIEPTSLSTASGASGMPNPPSVSSVLSSDWVIAIGHIDDDTFTATAPTNYTLIQTATIGSAGLACTTMSAYRNGVSGTEDPGVFGGGGTDDWIAHTLILKAG